ncbi:MAG TPA: hypothetical protein VGM52_06095 [Herbaspirillum sp.]|jgi:hypothetical protein
MKRYLLLIVVLLGGCVAVPYDGYSAYDPQYASPYGGYPSYGVYSAPAYVAPSIYFGGVYGRGYHGGHRGWHGHRR